ncbi:conjugal transfer entry exclusion protein TraS [Salmonella enterica]|nr:conjugal transfer entry exclusion protein TraS [Salmonella enterica]
MITHYDVKMETQLLKRVLVAEGINIPSLLQVMRPGLCVFLWMIAWPTFIRLCLNKLDVRDAGVDICFSGVMGFILFVGITNAMLLYYAVPNSFRKSSKLVRFMYSKGCAYIFSFLVVFTLVALLLNSFLYSFTLIVLFIAFFIIYVIDLSRYKLSAVVALIQSFRKEPVS